MSYDEEDEDSDEYEPKPLEHGHVIGKSRPGHEETEDEQEDDFASDFDDFEEGAAADDFGDFDDGIPGAAVAEKPVQPVLSSQPSQTTACPFVSRAIVISKNTFLDDHLTRIHCAIKQANLYVPISLFSTSPTSNPSTR